MIRQRSKHVITVNSTSRPFRATMLATAVIVTLGLITIAGRDVMLLLGAQYCSLPIVRFAMEMGANPNALNGLGRPLHHALRCSNNPDLVEFLLTHGADANAPDRNRHRPLWMASAIGDRNYVQLLIQRGARVNPQDPTEESPLTVAAMNDNVAVTRLLLGAGARVHGNDVAASDLHFAAMGGAAEVIPLLVHAGLDIDGVNQYGETPLYIAAVGSARSLRALLASGAHVNVRNLELSTPLIALSDSVGSRTFICC